MIPSSKTEALWNVMYENNIFVTTPAHTFIIGTDASITSPAQKVLTNLLTPFGNEKIFFPTSVNLRESLVNCVTK